MNRSVAAIFIPIIIVTGFTGVFLISCRHASMNGMIIATRMQERTPDNNNPEKFNSSIPNSQLIAIYPRKQDKPAMVLTPGFSSASSPEVSFDGKFLLFSGKQNGNDPSQIWEMNLENQKIRQVTYSTENCTDPAYLPGSRLVFSKMASNDSLKAGQSIYTCNLDGSDIKRITFNPHTYSASNVLCDGRILTISKQLYPAPDISLFIVMRPDGTKAEIFYSGPEGSTLSGRASETADGKVFFVEYDKGNPGKKNLVSVRYNRPLHSRSILNSGADNDFNSVFALQSGKLLVSWRNSLSDHYGLYEFDPESGQISKAVYSDASHDLSEAVVIGEHNRPKKLPSEVDLHVKTGLLLCQNINLLDPVSQKNQTSRSKASRIEILGIDSSLGTVKVEEDGSFYLKAMADTPFRIQTLDENGKVLNGPCGWMWLRPNERRGCAGCHEDHELTPENRVPFSVKKPPLIIPVHIEKVKEKTVELE